MHFETAGSARTPADEPTTAGRLHPGADRAAWRSDGGRLSIEARRSASIGRTADLMGEIDRSHSFARAAPNPIGAGFVEPLRSSAAPLESGRQKTRRETFPACKALKTHKTGIISPVM
jgi:hypothetical protein